MGLDFNKQFNEKVFADALQKKADDVNTKKDVINDAEKYDDGTLKPNEDTILNGKIDLDKLDLSGKIKDQIVQAEKEAVMGEALGEVVKKEDFEPIGWINPGTQIPTGKDKLGDLEDLIKNGGLLKELGDNVQKDKFILDTGKVDFLVKDDELKILQKAEEEKAKEEKTDNSLFGFLKTSVKDTPIETLLNIVSNGVNNILNNAKSLVESIKNQILAITPKAEAPAMPETPSAPAVNADSYKGINVAKNIYNTYVMDIISNNKNLTSKNLQVANYKLNSDGTINVDSLHSELKLVYKNLQKDVLAYYNSSEAGKAALKALGGEDNLRKIVDAAWQNRAINQSWTNKDVNMQEFIHSVMNVFEEMIRSIETDSECLTRLISTGFENRDYKTTAELASFCAQAGKAAAEKLKGGGQTVNTQYYKFEITEDANGFRKPTDQYIAEKTGIYFPNTADSYEQYAFDTALSRLRIQLSRMFPWMDSNLLYEDLNNANRLAMWGLANSTSGNTITISLEKYIETVTEYFMAYVNQDYRNNSNAQNGDYSTNW